MEGGCRSWGDMFCVLKKKEDAKNYVFILKSQNSCRMVPTV